MAFKLFIDEPPDDAVVSLRGTQFKRLCAVIEQLANPTIYGAQYFLDDAQLTLIINSSGGGSSTDTNNGQETGQVEIMVTANQKGWAVPFGTESSK